MGNGQERLFACTACGSPAVTAPATLDVAAFVHCGRCGRALMPWGDFKAQVEALVCAPGVSRAPRAPRPGCAPGRSG